MTLTTYLAGLGAGGGLIIAIGAQNAFVLRQGLQRRFVGEVVLICMLADACLIVAGVGGIGLAIQGHPWALRCLGYLGAAFLVTYGAMAARRAWHGESGLTPTTGDALGRGRVLLACLGFTFLNPHVYLDTVVLLGSISTHYGEEGRWVFAAGACTASAAWFVLLGYGARMLLPVFRSPLAWRVLDGLIALLMFALALFLLARPLV